MNMSQLHSTALPKHRWLKNMMDNTKQHLIKHITNRINKQRETATEISPWNGQQQNFRWKEGAFKLSQHGIGILVYLMFHVPTPCHYRWRNAYLNLVANKMSLYHFGLRGASCVACYIIVQIIQALRACCFRLSDVVRAFEVPF